MEFKIKFYVSASGSRPVDEFLEDLEQSDPEDYAAVMRGLDRIKHRQFHHAPLCKPLGEGLFELRHIGQLNARVLWFFMAGRRIVAVHGVRHKAQEILLGDLKIARERQRDWLRRMEQ